MSLILDILDEAKKKRDAFGPCPSGCSERGTLAGSAWVRANKSAVVASPFSVRVRSRYISETERSSRASTLSEGVFPTSRLRWRYSATLCVVASALLRFNPPPAPLSRPLLLVPRTPLYWLSFARFFRSILFHLPLVPRLARSTEISLAFRDLRRVWISVPVR